MDIVCPQVAAGLGRIIISDRKTAHTFYTIAFTGLLKQEVGEVIISAGALRRAHMKYRKLFSL